MQRKLLYAVIAVVAVVAVASVVLLTSRNNSEVPVSSSVAVSSSSAPAATPTPSPASETNIGITAEDSDNMFDITWNMYVQIRWVMDGEEPNEYFSDANTLTDEGRYEAFEIYMGVPEIFLADENMDEVYATSKYPDIVEQYKVYWAEPENAEKAQTEIEQLEYSSSNNSSGSTSTNNSSGGSSTSGSSGSSSGDLGYGMVDGTPLNEDGLFADGLRRPNLTDEERSTAEMDQQNENGRDWSKIGLG